MKYILACLSAIFIELQCSGATTYYVRTDGNNSNNGQSYSSGGAWATIQYGIDHIAGGDTLLIGPGTYTEGSYLAANTANSLGYSPSVSIASYSGNSADVTIQSSGASFCVLEKTGGMTWSNLTFTTHTTTDSAFYLGGGTNCAWYNCVFLMPSPAAAQRAIAVHQQAGLAISNAVWQGCSIVQSGNTNAAYGVAFESINVNNCSGFAFVNCTNSASWGLYATAAVSSMAVTNSVFQCNYYGVVLTGCTNTSLVGNTFYSTNGECVRWGSGMTSLYMLSNTACSFGSYGFNGVNVTLPVTNITIASCTVTSKQDAINIPIGKGVVISNCVCSTGNSGTRTICLGLDSDWNTSNGILTNGVIVGCAVTNTGGGHGIVTGANCTNAIVANNTIFSASGLGLVIKGCAGTQAINNTIYANQTSPSGTIFFKEATGATASHNVLIPGPSAQYCVSTATDGTGLKGCTNCTFIYNWCVIPNGVTNINWGEANGDSGGGAVIDYNTYFFSGSVKVGRLNGGVTATSIEQWRTNWVNYSVAGNETHSYYGPTINPGFAGFQ